MYYSKSELIKLGFSSVGENNKISKLAKFYAVDGSILGSNNRIDDYCLFKGKIIFGDYIHIAGFCLLSAVGASIKINNYSGFSSHCSFFTSIEDFINPTLLSPALNKKYSKSIAGKILIEEAVKLGTHCVILPNVTIGFGSSAAANTIISKNVKEGAVIGPRNRHFKVYGYRNLEDIKKLKIRFEE